MTTANTMIVSHDTSSRRPVTGLGSVTGAGRSALIASWRDMIAAVPGSSRDGSGDFPAEHHGVVLVGQVVAVRHVRPDEVTEPAIDDHRFARIEPDDIFL